MFVWGGDDGSAFGPGPGGLYFPQIDAWVPVSQTNTPSARHHHTTIWTGTHAVVWGGSEIIGDDTASGGRYNPLNNTWTPTSLGTAPSARSFHTGVWTGNRMVVWGGCKSGPCMNSGGRYDPLTDSWTPTSQLEAPQGRRSHTAVWTGSVMIVWGGLHGSGSAIGLLNDGGRYDPVTDSWSPVVAFSLLRYGHTAVWTGNRMVIWGGRASSNYTNYGGQYDPATNTWAQTSRENPPPIRYNHTAVWTGSEMIVWGGFPYTRSGGRYDPVTDVWTPTSFRNTPSPRRLLSSVWTGEEMIVFGNQSAGRYRPSDDSWHTLIGSISYSFFTNAAAVWTGQHVITWGGVGNVNSGGSDFGFRFEPAGPPFLMSMTGDPIRRYHHTAVWTGESMIVWGGWVRFDVHPLRSGGLYFLTVDGDGDGAIDQCDCRPEDPLVFDGPSEIQKVIWTDSETLEWDSDEPNSGSGTSYDVVRGELAGLPVGGASEVCWESDSDDASAPDTTEPSSGTGYYYLVRGENACGVGSYGQDSEANARVTTACP